MTVPPPCCCGNNIQSLHDVPRSSLNLDASFVHLESTNHLPWNALKQTETLFQVITTQNAILDENIWLCVECLERAARSMEADNERLQMETKAYEVQQQDHEERVKMCEKMLSNNVFFQSREGDHHVDDDDDDNYDRHNTIRRIEAVFEEEVAALEQAIARKEEELCQLKDAMREQIVISKRLDELEENDAHDENALELEARALCHVQQQLSATLEAAQLEIDQLAAADLPLFPLVIDKRGLRYPLINELRLAFSPKRDLDWDEIQAAWGQVAQLLLFMDLQKKGWRIIPLTSCAKLIHDKRVYTLGISMSSMASALRALVRLLESTSPSPPFSMTVDTIGDVRVADLPDTDHPGWSRVVHYLACNLLHLSELAAQKRRNKLKILLL